MAQASVWFEFDVVLEGPTSNSFLYTMEYYVNCKNN